MKSLLDNAQLERITDIIETTQQTFETIGINNGPMGLILESCTGYSRAMFYYTLENELQEYHPTLAGLARDAGDRILEILEED